MGQKVSPVGLRIGINKTWESKWYAGNKDFSKFLNKDVKIRRYLEKKLKDAAVSSILIERNATKTDVIINTAKPGVVIGHGGDEIEKLKRFGYEIITPATGMLANGDIGDGRMPEESVLFEAVV